MFNCEILADSLSPQGQRLITMKITFPRIVLAEFNTHRMLSRNSASSRAIPFKKMVQMVKENPFIPIAWQKDHKGMQGTEYLKDVEAEVAERNWLIARDNAVMMATHMNAGEITKQLCNRLLEPFMWHTVICTASEWENFFNLRCPDYRTHDEGARFNSKKDYLKYFPESKQMQESALFWLKINKSQAEIHIQAIAELMWDAYNESKPKQLQAGEWHLPFGDKISYGLSNWKFLPNIHELWGKDMTEYGVKIATARCARISYETLGDDPKIDYEADIKLHDILLKNGHASPLEHCARAMSDEEFQSYSHNTPIYAEVDHQKVVVDNTNEFGWCRNFRGFIQYRAIAGL